MGKLGIKPFGKKATDFICTPPEKDAPITILEGSVSSAKTWAMIPKLIDLCSYKVGGIGLITGVSKESIKRNVLNDVFSIVGPKNYRYSSTTGELRLLGDLWYVVGAKDEGSAKNIQGATVGKWYADELTKHPKSFVDMGTTRLRREGSRMYATTNADNPFHFVKTDFIDNYELRANGTYKVLQFRLEDNPNIPEEYKERTRRMYKGVFKLRYIDGLWVVAEGSIYRDCWDEKTLLYNRADEPIGLRGQGGYVRRWITVDYGTNNPCVFLDWYDDGKYFWLVNEYYWDSVKEGLQKSDGQYADDLVEFMGRGRGCEIICDPSALSFKVELQKRGLWVRDANNEVLDGIRTTSTALANGVIRINRDDCRMTCVEMPTYSWDPKASERGEDKPIKKRDHTCDGVRYFVETAIDPWRLAA